MDQEQITYLSKHLHTIRQALEMNQYELSEAIGFSRPLLGEVEQGRRVLSLAQARSLLHLLFTHHARVAGIAPVLLRMPGGENIYEQIRHNMSYLRDYKHMRGHILAAEVKRVTSDVKDRRREHV